MPGLWRSMRYVARTRVPCDFLCGPKKRGVREKAMAAAPFSLPKAAVSAEVRPGVRLAVSIVSKDNRACVVLAPEAAGAPGVPQPRPAPPQSDGIPEIQLNIDLVDGEARVVFTGDLIDAQNGAGAASSSAAAAAPKKPPLPALRVGAVPGSTAPVPISQRPAPTGRQPTARDNVTARLQGGGAAYLARKRAAAAQADAVKEEPDKPGGAPSGQGGAPTGQGGAPTGQGGNRSELEDAVARAQAAEGRAEAAEVRAAQLAVL